MVAATMVSVIVFSSLLVANLLIYESADAQLRVSDMTALEQREYSMSHVLLAEASYNATTNCRYSGVVNGTVGSFMTVAYSMRVDRENATDLLVSLNETALGRAPSYSLSQVQVRYRSCDGMALLVPLYSPPGQYWDELAQVASNSSAPVTAIVNPANGPGQGRSSTFASGIATLQAKDVTVLGYVDTARGSLPLSTIEQQVAEYRSWYNASGVFLDDFPQAISYEGYYDQITAYSRSLGMTVVVGNPGSAEPSTYQGTVTAMNIYEGDGLPSPLYLRLATTELFNSSRSYAMIATNVGSLPNESYFASISQYVKYVWISSTGNDYISLPPISYLNQELADILAAS